MNPALTYDPNLTTLYVLESWSSANGLLRMSTISGAVGSEVLSTGVALPAAPQPWQAVEPAINFAPQLGSANRIDMDDDRLDWTVYRNGSLWTAQTVSCRPVARRIDARCSGGRSTLRRATSAVFSNSGGSTIRPRRDSSPIRRSG